MTDNKISIACFGEILWDMFPDKSLLGGAPLNVAMRLHSMGAEVNMISSVGSDELGTTALEGIETRGLNTACIRIHPALPTGSVTVTLDKGSATYEIKQPVAWDEITIEPLVIAAVQQADALVFGSLALRSDFNLNILLELSKHAKQLIFDINLRPPFYNDQLIEKLIYLADFLKLNDEELVYVRELLDIDESEPEKTLSTLSEKTSTPAICVTRGDKGAWLYHEGTLYNHPGYEVNVVDTVGAGDSFLAGLLYALFSGKSPEESLDLACALGGLVASKAGANCTVSSAEIEATRK